MLSIDQIVISVCLFLLALQMSARKVNFQLGQRKGGVAPSKTTSPLESHRVEPNDIENGANREEMTLYPLKDLLQEVIRQEKQAWNKNHGIHIPVEGLLPWLLVVCLSVI